MGDKQNPGKVIRSRGEVESLNHNKPIKRQPLLLPLKKDTFQNR